MLVFLLYVCLSIPSLLLLIQLHFYQPLLHSQVYQHFHRGRIAAEKFVLVIIIIYYYQCFFFRGYMGVCIPLNPYSAKGLGDRLYATLHKMPGEVGYSFCLFLKL